MKNRTNRVPKINYRKLDGTELSTKHQNYILSRVLIHPSGCWLWTKGKNRAGYGTASVRRHPVFAHRLSHWAFKGPIPEDRIILHSCHNKSCVNPDHLRAGTVSENLLDAIRIGAAKPIPIEKSIKLGSRHGMSKITEGTVLKIFRMRKMAMIQRDIAEIVGLSRSQVGNILRGYGWGHVK